MVCVRRQQCIGRKSGDARPSGSVGQESPFTDQTGGHSNVFRWLLSVLCGKVAGRSAGIDSDSSFRGGREGAVFGRRLKKSASTRLIYHHHWNRIHYDRRSSERVWNI